MIQTTETARPEIFKQKLLFCYIVEECIHFTKVMENSCLAELLKIDILFGSQTLEASSQGALKHVMLK